jgi:hypothetical protein
MLMRENLLKIQKIKKYKKIIDYIFKAIVLIILLGIFILLIVILIHDKNENELHETTIPTLLYPHLNHSLLYNWSHPYPPRPRWRLLLCKKICAEKPSEGGHYCNCLKSKYPMFYSSLDVNNSNESSLF